MDVNSKIKDVVLQLHRLPFKCSPAMPGWGSLPARVQGEAGAGNRLCGGTPASSPGLPGADTCFLPHFAPATLVLEISHIPSSQALCHLGPLHTLCSGPTPLLPSPPPTPSFCLSAAPRATWLVQAPPPPGQVPFTDDSQHLLPPPSGSFSLHKPSDCLLPRARTCSCAWDTFRR